MSIKGPELGETWYLGRFKGVFVGVGHDWAMDKFFIFELEDQTFFLLPREEFFFATFPRISKSTGRVMPLYRRDEEGELQLCE